MCTTDTTQPKTEPDPPAPASCSPSDTVEPSPSPPPGSRPPASASKPSSATESQPKASLSSHPQTTMPQDLEAQLVPMSMIHVEDDRNGRASLDMTHATSLAHQIAKDGLLHPITLRPKDDRFELIAGRHRLEAFRILGWDHAPALIKTVDDFQAGILRMSENVNRSQLSPAEEAWQLADLLNQTPGGVEELAARTGRSVNWVLDRLDMAEWPEALLQAIHNGKISMAAAKPLVRIRDPALRDLRIADAARSGINARTASLWLQASESDTPADFEPSEKGSQIPILGISTTTSCQCFCCRRRVDFNTTRPVRMCADCINDLETAATQRAAQPLEEVDSQIQERNDSP